MVLLRSRNLQRDVYSPKSETRRGKQRSLASTSAETKDVTESLTCETINEKLNDYDNSHCGLNVLSSSNIAEVVTPLRCKQLVVSTDSPQVKRFRFDSSTDDTAKHLTLGLSHRLIGRDEEVSYMTTLLESAIIEKKALPIYVCGVSGTGKTATLRYVLKNLKKKFAVRGKFFNCMNSRHGSDVLQPLCEWLGVDVQGKTMMTALKKHVRSMKNMHIAVLDELDQLDDIDEEMLETLFDVSATVNSQLILVGIANSLDFAERRLAKSKPIVMSFKPYTAQQIVAILKDRLQESNLFEPAAVEFCARKVSAVTGDIRKALDVCRIAVHQLQASGNAGTKESELLTACLTPRRQLAVKDIVRAVNEATAPKTGSTLPLQQKVLLASLLRCCRGKKSNDVCLQDLSATYVRLCDAVKVAPCGQAELFGMCELLEAQGLVCIGKTMRKSSVLHKIQLLVEEAVVDATLRDHALLSTALSV